VTNIFVAGDVTLNSLIYMDHFPAPQPQTIFSKRFHETVGGTGAGKALNLHKLGLNVTFHGLIGRDYYGDLIRRRFEQEHLPFFYDVDPAGTQRHVNLMEDSGARISIYVAYATFEPVLDLAPIESAVIQSDLVVINLSNYCRQIIPLAKKHNKPLWCDIHDYDGANPYHAEFIESSDCFTMSSDRMPAYRAFMQAQIASGKQVVVCTHGRTGSTALSTNGAWIETPGLPYTQIDTNGAGDSFFAGLLYGFTQGCDLARSVRLGTLLGGLCVTSPELVYPDLSAELLEAEYLHHYGNSS